MPPDEDLKQAREQTKKDQDEHAQIVARLKAAGVYLPPGATRLPTPHEAAMALTQKMQAAGKSPSTDEVMKAYNDARAAEVKAVELRMGGEVDSDELASIQALQQIGQQVEQRAKECPNGIQAGMTIDKVYACKGYPDHTNSDSSTDQLVYPDGTYVYIDRSTGRVEDMQWTH
jgi:hypothetical protein